MHELGYRPNRVARGLRARRTCTIGLIVPDNANPYFAELSWHIEQAGVAAGFGIMLCNTGNLPGLEASCVEVFLEKRVDGIILVSGSEASKALHQVVSANVPLVLLSREVPGANADVLVLDNRLGGALAARHLLDLGHRRIAYIGRESAISPSVARLEGFRTVLAESEVPLTSEHIVAAYSRAEDGYRAAMSLLRRDPGLTGIFAFNDIIALGALRAAHDCGYKVPETMSIVGFDDISLANLSVPRLTTISHSMAEMGRQAVELITERLDSPDQGPKRNVLPVSLVVRESTAACPPQ